MIEKLLLLLEALIYVTDDMTLLNTDCLVILIPSLKMMFTIPHSQYAVVLHLIETFQLRFLFDSIYDIYHVYGLSKKLTSSDSIFFMLNIRETGKNEH